MQIKNLENRFGIVGISFHWIIAAIIISMLILGLYMTGLPNSLQKLKLFGWHKEFGILVLILACLRFGWRFININPSLDNSLPVWQKLAARGVCMWAPHCIIIYFERQCIKANAALSKRFWHQNLARTIRFHRPY